MTLIRLCYPPSSEVRITSLTSLIIWLIILLKVPISVKSVTNSKDTSIFRISDLGSLEGADQFLILDNFVRRIADFLRPHMIFWHQHTLKWYSQISVLRILTALVCDFNSIIQGLYQNRATTYSWTHFFIPWEIKNPKIYSIPFLFCCFWIKKNTLSIWIGSFTWFIFNQTWAFTPLQSEKWNVTLWK